MAVFSFHRSRGWSGDDDVDCQITTYQIQTYQIQTYQIQSYRIQSYRIQTYRIQTCQIQTCQIQTCQIQTCQIQILAGAVGYCSCYAARLPASCAGGGGLG